MKMWKNIASMTASVALAAGLAAAPAMAAPQAPHQQQNPQAQQDSWTGKIEKKEMQQREVYVFTVGGQSYMVTPQDKAAEFEGKTVTITGKLEGNTVTISDIKES